MGFFTIILKVLHKGRLPYFLFGGNFPLGQIWYFLILKVFLNISAGITSMIFGLITLSSLPTLYMSFMYNLFITLT